MSLSDSPRLRLYADRDGRGRIRTTYLVNSDGQLTLTFADTDDPEPPQRTPVLHLVGPLSYVAVRMVFERYGRPLDPDLDVTAHTAREQPDDQRLLLTDTQGVTSTLARFRYKPYGWVYPADYLLWSPSSGEPVAAEAPLITSALSALAQAAQARRA